MFQPYVEKAFELRVVVMGEKIFAAKMDSQADEASRIDWRGGNPDHEIFELPAEVKAALHRLMDSFGLNFASLDMIVTPDDEYVFLELNPNGQWLWLEHELGLPLVSTMADLLTTNHTPAADRREAARAT
jgi:glutathione synthase/RimK-type ligase-like ATP-grasp enzyme